MKKQNGVTLVALVITIIILIILAGITISMILGEDGLIAKSKRGADNFQTAATDEQKILSDVNDFLDGKIDTINSGNGTDNGTITNNFIPPKSEDASKEISTGNLSEARTISKRLTPGKYIISISYSHGYTYTSERTSAVETRVTNVSSTNNKSEISELISDGYERTANAYSGSTRNYIKAEHRLFYANVTEEDDIIVSSAVNNDNNVPEILSVEYLKIK